MTSRRVALQGTWLLVWAHHYHHFLLHLLQLGFKVASTLTLVSTFIVANIALISSLVMNLEEWKWWGDQNTSLILIHDPNPLTHPGCSAFPIAMIRVSFLPSRMNDPSDSFYLSSFYNFFSNFISMLAWKGLVLLLLSMDPSLIMMYWR